MNLVRLLCFALLAIFHIAAADDELIGENESVFVGTTDSVTYTREGAGDACPNSPIYCHSCGTEVVEISGIRPVAGLSLPDTIRTVNPLGESCRSPLEMILFPDVLMSVVLRDNRFSILWFGFMLPNSDGDLMILWRPSLDDRFGTLVAKVPCEFGTGETEAEPCFEVRFDEFANLFRQ